MRTQNVRLARYGNVSEQLRLRCLRSLLFKGFVASLAEQAQTHVGLWKRIREIGAGRILGFATEGNEVNEESAACAKLRSQGQVARPNVFASLAPLPCCGDPLPFSG